MQILMKWLENDNFHTTDTEQAYITAWATDRANMIHLSCLGSTYYYLIMLQAVEMLAAKS